MQATLLESFTIGEASPPSKLSTATTAREVSRPES